MSLGKYKIMTFGSYGVAALQFSLDNDQTVLIFLEQISTNSIDLNKQVPIGFTLLTILYLTFNIIDFL